MTAFAKNRRLGRAMLALAMVGTATAAWAQAPGTFIGHPQTLTPHVATRHVPASLLAPVQLHADAKAAISKAYTGVPIDVTQL